ncbi:MAG: hypothetical protein AAGM67_06120, partial [Bacteroidota bacterium]
LQKNVMQAYNFTKIAPEKQGIPKEEVSCFLGWFWGAASQNAFIFLNCWIVDLLNATMQQCNNATMQQCNNATMQQ